MTDAASSFRLLISLRKIDYSANLQFCCDHYRSVSEVCRRVKVNRQQFNRYLTGSASPSRHNHRLISTFFGLEEDELLAPHGVFVQSFKLRSDAQQEFAPPVGLLQTASGAAARSLSDYQGYYFKYFYSYLGTQRIKRELARWSYRDDVLVSSVKQRYLGEDEEGKSPARFITYRGIVGTLGDRLFTTDFQRGSAREVATMILYPKGRLLERLHGMTIGVSHGAARSIAAARVVMDFIGTEIDVRAALGRLGTFGVDEPSVPDAIKRSITNDMRADEPLFFARP